MDAPRPLITGRSGAAKIFRKSLFQSACTLQRLRQRVFGTAIGDKQSAIDIHPFATANGTDLCPTIAFLYFVSSSPPGASLLIS